MLGIVKVEDMKGYRIEVGTDVIPVEIRSIMDEIDKYLDQFKDLKIANNDDYINMDIQLKTVQSLEDKINGCNNKLLAPIDRLRNALVKDIDQLRGKRNYTDQCIRKTMIDWNVEMTRKRNEEKADNLKKAKEKELKLKKEMESKILAEKEKATLLESQRKAKVEEKKLLEKKKVEEQQKALQINNQIEETRKDVANDSVKEIENLEIQKESITETVKKIETDILTLNGQIKLVSKEEMGAKQDAQKFIAEKDALVIAPEPPLTKVPKIKDLSFVTNLNYKVIDIDLVPLEWVDITLNEKTNKDKLVDLVPKDWLDKTIKDKAIKDALKKVGKDLKIPGIEIFEIKNLRSKYK